jgi:hypothetical protein
MILYVGKDSFVLQIDGRPAAFRVSQWLTYILAPFGWLCINSHTAIMTWNLAAKIRKEVLLAAK